MTVGLKHINQHKICVIGLGYVGLPLARLFSTKFETIGFDVEKKRVDAIMNCEDSTMEVDRSLLPSLNLHNS